MTLVVALFVVAAAPPPLQVHIEVALCDVASQGVSPPPIAAMCDAARPGRNLYWGARYGVKTFLPPALGVSAEAASISPAERAGGARERFVLRTRLSNRAVHITVTAWSDIKTATRLALSPRDADLLVYVGHNGLLDFSEAELPPSPASGDKPTDVAVLACLSASRFSPLLEAHGHRPFVMTNALLGPEAYVVEAVVRAWAAKKSGVAAADDAAVAYQHFTGTADARAIFWP